MGCAGSTHDMASDHSLCSFPVSGCHSATPISTSAATCASMRSLSVKLGTTRGPWSEETHAGQVCGLSSSWVGSF